MDRVADGAEAFEVIEWAAVIGAEWSVRAASITPDCRGIISDCPGLSRALTERLLASAMSARDMPYLRPTVSSVSPFFAVYHFSVTKSAGEASASFALSWSAV